MASKTCTICQQTKTLTEFHRSKAAKDGHVSLCKTCKSAKDKKRWEEDPEVRRKRLEDGRRFRAANPNYEKDYARAWRVENPEKKAATNRRYAERHPERVRKSARKSARKNLRRNRNGKYLRQYGITLEEYETKLKSQNGVCAICGGVDKINLAIDHDHTTGVIRGLLCSRCNIALGGFQDNSTLLENAINYLKGDNE